jgi:hypothetical protein
MHPEPSDPKSGLGLRVCVCLQARVYLSAGMGGLRQPEARDGSCVSCTAGVSFSGCTLRIRCCVPPMTLDVESRVSTSWLRIPNNTSSTLGKDWLRRTSTNRDVGHELSLTGRNPLTSNNNSNAGSKLATIFGMREECWEMEESN